MKYILLFWSYLDPWRSTQVAGSEQLGSGSENPIPHLVPQQRLTYRWYDIGHDVAGELFRSNNYQHCGL
ncbi:hypothetical protein Sjap_015567 [Stephania japonica]|uniref:Uncharacterized protein n=1 Tax=Stephania japonica TaxID=461633 RepID=A0AAP0NSY7_9MAGN